MFNIKRAETLHRRARNQFSTADNIREWQHKSSPESIPGIFFPLIVNITIYDHQAKIIEIVESAKDNGRVLPFEFEHIRKFIEDEAQIGLIKPSKNKQFDLGKLVDGGRGQNWYGVQFCLTLRATNAEQYDNIVTKKQLVKSEILGDKWVLIEEMADTLQFEDANRLRFIKQLTANLTEGQDDTLVLTLPWEWVLPPPKDDKPVKWNHRCLVPKGRWPIFVKAFGKLRSHIALRIPGVNDMLRVVCNFEERESIWAFVKVCFGNEFTHPKHTNWSSMNPFLCRVATANSRMTSYLKDLPLNVQKPLESPAPMCALGIPPPPPPRPDHMDKRKIGSTDDYVTPSPHKYSNVQYPPPPPMGRYPNQAGVFSPPCPTSASVKGYPNYPPMKPNAPTAKVFYPPVSAKVFYPPAQPNFPGAPNFSGSPNFPPPSPKYGMPSPGSQNRGRRAESHIQADDRYYVRDDLKSPPKPAAPPKPPSPKGPPSSPPSSVSSASAMSSSSGSGPSHPAPIAKAKPVSPAKKLQKTVQPSMSPAAKSVISPAKASTSGKTSPEKGIPPPVLDSSEDEGDTWKFAPVNLTLSQDEFQKIEDASFSKKSVVAVDYTREDISKLTENYVQDSFQPQWRERVFQSLSDRTRQNTLRKNADASLPKLRRCQKALLTGGNV